ncbi:CHC2 zinc finger domain-containing protein [Phocaeicola coprocola]|uniref:CHC2 zinc finger domain-containing protein n=1 Tax=Phocaeicola coprocola TaxID=310298 RepID=UPI0029438C05|nr:CHC2 zinc finger domain-containing protein [Phocaeicola coprocola]
MSQFFTKDNTDRIKKAAEGHVLEVIRDFQDMEEQKGYDYRGKCPVCGKQTFNYNSKKELYGCFNKCNVGGHDAITYLMKVQNMAFNEALSYLADRFHVTLLDNPVPEKKKAQALKKNSKALKGVDSSSYCVAMLQGSGLTFEDVAAHIYDSSTNHTVTLTHTFSKGTVNSKGDIDTNGDDVIIKYYDLEGLPVKYEQKDAKGKPTGKMREYFRVRWQYPEEHLDKEGKPFKYRSPYGGGTPIYIPDKIRQLYKKGEHLKRLFIQEGEKKAEKACKHGMYSLAISGIQNIACGGRLPEDLIRIIEKCHVEEVIFIMDSDWNDLSTNIRINDQVEKRPRNFYYAARNFRDYMGSLRNRELYVEIYVGHVQKNEQNEKGIDDLLAGSLQGKEQELMADFDKLINEKNLTGKYLQLFRISAYTDHKLSTLWGLDSVKHFAEMHKDVLSRLPEFRYGSHRWRINESGQLESAQAIESDEMFWEAVEKSRRSGDTYTEYEFRYVPSRRFLQNRGFGRFRRLDGSFQFIRLEQPFVRVIEASEARDFLFEFAENNCNEAVNEMLSKGVTQYVGPDKLSLLHFIYPDFLHPVGTEQFFYFQKNCWRVTEHEVKELGYESISHHVWAEQRRDFPAKYLGRPLITFSGNGDTLDYSISQDGKNCHFLQFLINTSNFTWRKREVEIEPEEFLENRKHLLSKLCAIGYMAMEYKDVSVNRAVIGMDGKQSEVGESNGRSGKSLIGVLMKHILPSAYVNGKRKDLLEDQFVWNDVVENTKLVFIDDVLMNFNFERLFPNLTGDWTVNYKGGRRITFPYETSPKIYIATNHAIRGEGASFTDRQWLLGFSDFYNDAHKPIDDFGCNFFTEWDFEQWNLCWNLVANCVQLYLQYGVVQAPQERLIERRLRQEITEVFISWADEYFSDESHINARLVRRSLYDEYCNYDPNMRKYTNSPTEFKKRLLKYCQFRGYIFNPQKLDPVTGKPCKFDPRNGNPILDDKAGGVEYFTIGTPDYYSSPEYAQQKAANNSDSRLSF